MVLLFETIISWRVQREVIVEAHFIVSGDHSTDFGAVYPNNIKLSYDMSKFLLYLWKAKWNPVDFTWPVSEKSEYWHMTYFVRSPSEFCHHHMCQMYYGISVSIFELGGHTNFEY